MEYDGRCRHCYDDAPHTAEQHAESVAAYVDSVRDEHQAAAGIKCHEGPDGMCILCGVEMTHCNVCDGIGYHREGCRLSEDGEPYEMVLLVDGIHHGDDRRRYAIQPGSAVIRAWAKELIGAGDWEDWSGSGRICRAVVRDGAFDVIGEVELAL
jgi:hypothetical protein